MALFVVQVAQGELKLLDIADPRILARGCDAGIQVGFDQREPVALCGVDLQETATHAGVFVGAAGERSRVYASPRELLLVRQHADTPWSQGAVSHIAMGLSGRQQAEDHCLHISDRQPHATNG